MDVTQISSCGENFTDHPPLETWPKKSLILGQCPKCSTSGLYDDNTFARMILARKKAEGIGGATVSLSE